MRCDARWTHRPLNPNCKKIYICPKYHKMPAGGLKGEGEGLGAGGAARRGCNNDAVCCIKATLQIAN